MTPSEIPEDCVPTSGESEVGYGEFTCAVCHETWTRARSDEEAQEEYRQLFPRAAATSQPTEVLCHDCFLQMEFYRRGVRRDDLEMPEA